MSIEFKACPRCRGDMMREEMPGSVELVCLQCGHRTANAAGGRVTPIVNGIRKAA